MKSETRVSSRFSKTAQCHSIHIFLPLQCISVHVVTWSLTTINTD